MNREVKEESDSDFSDVEFIVESFDKNSYDSDWETENEIDNNESNRNVASSIDPMFISKNRMAWRATPFPKPIESAA